MKLILLRHADAATLAEIDDERALSKLGEKQSHRIAHFCRQLKRQPEVILASPLLRAQQTAQPVADALELPIKTVPWLMYGTAPARVTEQLAKHSEATIMIVGHEPDFSRLAVYLIGTNDEGIRVRKASLIQLDISELRAGGARLDWSIPCKFL